MKPATPLPWKCKQVGDTGGKNQVGVYEIRHEPWRVAEYANDEDAAYIAHACNAYPKLVEALRSIAKLAWGGKLQQYAAQAILRELGEAK